MSGTTLPESPPPLIAAPAAQAPSTGARSAALIGSASVVGMVANYAFLLAAGRILGSADYGALAALLGLLAVVLIPASALQMAVSREVSRRLAHGDVPGASTFSRQMLRLSLLATVPLLLLALAASVPLSALLHIDSAGIVALALVTLTTALVSPVAMGILQGRQRFHALALLYVVPWALRLGLLAAASAAGYRLGGAVVATLAGAVVTALLALWMARPQPVSPREAGPSELRPFLRYLALVSLGLVGIALLSHLDLLIVKARFSAEMAGAYGAASAFARVGFFLPAAILAVLFPRTAARQARGEETEDILGRSLLATAGFCGLLALFYAATGVGLVTTSFGPDFAAGGEILAPFALAIGLFSLANVLVGYHLSRGETHYAWLVAGGVVAQVILLALVPSSLEGVVWTNVAVGAGLVLAHELLVGSSLPALRAGLRHVEGALAWLRTVGPEALLVLGGTTALVVGLFWPVVRHLGSTIIGSPGSDSTGSVAAFWQMREESGFHLLGSTHHTLTGAPFGWEETNGLNIQWLVPYYPTYLASYVVGEVAAFNLATLSGYVLSGAAMYALVRYLGGARLVAAWAALVFVVFPWHIVRAEHASLVHLEVFPLLLIALVAYARRPTLPRLVVVGVAVLASWLTSGYFGAMATIAASAFGAGAALFSRRRRLLLALGPAALALAATALVAAASLISGAGRDAGLDRPLGDLSIYGLRPLELVVPPASSLVFGGLLQTFWDGRGHGSNPTETPNYLGLVTIVLAVGWLWLAWRRRRSLPGNTSTVTLGLVAAFLVGVAFAAPSPVEVLGRLVPTPSRLLWEVTPAFRVPSRWTPFLMAALVPLAALGLHRGYEVLRRRPKYGRALATAAIVAAAGLSATELLASPAEKRFRTVPVPPVYAALERTPPGVLVEYPLGYSDVYRLWQRRHGRPLLNGAPPDTPADQARLVLLDPASPGTAQALSLLGVTAIIVHRRTNIDAEVLPRQPIGVSGYRLVGRYRDGDSLWQVTARPAPALVTLPGGFAKPRRGRDGLVLYPLVSPAGVGAVELRARQAGVVRLTFDAEPPRGTRRVLRVADSEREVAFTLQGRTRISVAVAVPRGLSRLLVKTDPAATSEKDAVALSAPRAQAASGKPALHADPIEPDPGF